MRKILSNLFAVALMSLAAAQASAIVITEAALTSLETEMETIFLAGNIDIFFQSPIVIEDPSSFLTIESNAEMEGALFFNDIGQTLGGPVVTAYIVDSIEHCGGFNPAICWSTG